MLRFEKVVIDAELLLPAIPQAGQFNDDLAVEAIKVPVGGHFFGSALPWPFARPLFLPLLSDWSNFELDRRGSTRPVGDRVEAAGRIRRPPLDPAVTSPRRSHRAPAAETGATAAALPTTACDLSS
jgi:hypothetical protein